MGRMMLADERRRRIVDGFSASNSLRTEELAAAFDVSVETIRRDFRVLEDQGRIRRVHGGAVLLEGAQVEEPYPDRILARTEEKHEIAAEVVKLLPEGGTIFFDLGTTVAAVVSAIPLSFAATAVTTSVYVATLFGQHENVEVLVAGGRMRRGDLSLSGPMTLRFLESLYPDVAVISTGAIDSVAGVTDYVPDEVENKRTMLRNAKQTIAVADSTKFGRTAPFQVCRIEDPDVIVADSGLSEQSARLIHGAGGKVLTP